MAYPSQTRYANANNYYDAPRSAPLESPREYRDDGYGGQNQQQSYARDNGYAPGYNQGGPRRPPRQQYQQGPPRQARGAPAPQGRPPPRSSGRNGPNGPMREQRGGYQERRGHSDQQYRYDNTYQQGPSRGYSGGYQQNGYSEGYDNQDQYDNGYDQGQRDDEYEYQQRDGYGQPQQSRQQYGFSGSEGSRTQPSHQQDYSQDGYDQRARSGTGGPNRPPPERHDKSRMPAKQPHSPDTASWDNPFPTFPTPHQRRPEQQRPSTASGRYQDSSGEFPPYGQGSHMHATAGNFSDPNLNYDHLDAYNDPRTISPPQPIYTQEPQRSNTMPMELAQDMANLNIQQPITADEPPKGRTPPQHLNFSQPRRPSAGNQGGSSSRQQSRSRTTSQQDAGYDGVLRSYTGSPNPGPSSPTAPFSSPGTEEMPNFGAAQNQEVDKTLHLAQQPGPSYDNGRGRQQDRGRDFRAEQQRSRSQPNYRHQTPTYGDAPAVPSMNSQYSENAQNFPSRNTSSPQNYQKPLPQQQMNQEQWDQQGREEFGAPTRAQTDMFGPGQGPSRQLSDSNNRAPNRGLGLPSNPRRGGSFPTPPGAVGSMNGSRGTTPVNGSRTSMEDRNGSRTGLILPNTGTVANSDSRPVSNPDALPEHPAPGRAGQMGASMGGNPARPPPVRNYNGGFSSPPSEQQTLPPPVQYQQKTSPPPAQYQQQPPLPPQQTAQAIPKSEGPITYAELQRIRDQVYQNPSDQALQLHLAKRIADAAITLADEGGRADPKTKAKNRDRYNKEALLLVKKLVGFNNTDAMFYMAECYGNGVLGLQKDPSQAFTMYQSAAKLNHAAAAYRVAVCCEIGSDEGGGTRRDPLKAVQWYQRAATLGDVPAMYKIGVIQMKGLLGQPQNSLQAVTWLKRAAERADAENPHAVHELVSDKFTVFGSIN